MTNVSALATSLLLVSLNNCATPHRPPQIETCIHNDSNSAECTDLRLPKDKQSYTNVELTNYICTNPKDEQTMYNYCADMREKLIQCERKSCSN